jgi:hypothetical protein
MIILCLLAAVFVGLFLGLFRNHVSATQLASLNWEDLISRLEPVESEGIAAMAVEHLHPGTSQLGTETDDMWKMIGGAKGLARMRANADVLIALAALAQEWSPEEGVIVAERMRRDGLALRRAVVGIGLGMTCGYGKRRAASYIHEAASAYYLMRLRLLALYEASHAARYPSLAAAL